MSSIRPRISVGYAENAVIITFTDEKILEEKDIRAIQESITPVIEQPEPINLILDRLIMVGDQDVATIPQKSERIKASIKDSKLIIIQGAGHTASVEEPQAINAALQNFYKELS